MDELAVRRLGKGQNSGFGGVERGGTREMEAMATRQVWERGFGEQKQPGAFTGSSCSIALPLSNNKISEMRNSLVSGLSPVKRLPWSRLFPEAKPMIRLAGAARVVLVHTPMTKALARSTYMSVIRAAAGDCVDVHASCCHWLLWAETCLFQY